MKAELQSEPAKLGYGDYLRFRDLVLERSGLYFPEKRRVNLEAGLFKALAASAMFVSEAGYNLDGYYELLRDKHNPIGKAELERLLHTLTVGETHFFRDEAQFNALRAFVLPEIIARKRAAAAAVGPGINPQLRIWSAGCATGEEAYSIAVLLSELLPDLDRWHILILATDINQESLNRACRAYYSDWSFREARAKALRSTYFTYNPSLNGRFDHGRYRLRDDIRQMVTFASLNLIEDDYPALHNNTASMD
jgi:chemotaxis protein methyltransferase CheR